MAGAVQNAGVVATGVAARGGGVAGSVIKVNVTGCSFTGKEYHACSSHTTLMVFCASLEDALHSQKVCIIFVVYIVYGVSYYIKLCFYLL